MPGIVSRLYQRFLEFWKSLDKSQKTRIYIIGAILVVAIVVGSFFLTRTAYVNLISTNDKSEQALMVKVLEEGKFKYKTSGTDILIDSKQLNKAEALLVENGYPSSPDAIFADAFTKIKLSSTESDKRKLFIKSQGITLAAKLKMFDYIDDASVELAIPEPAVFLISDGDESKPTAAVMVKPRGQLDKKQVHAITMFVARSVENMDPKDVTVVDFDLNELTTQSDNPGVDKANDQYEMKRIVKKGLESDVQKALLGLGSLASFDNMSVVVNPVLDFDTLKQRSKTLKNPEGMDGPAVISREDVNIKLINGETANGTPGTGTNPGTGTTTYPIDTGNSNSEYTEKRSKVNNGYNETESETEKALGDTITEESTIAINLAYGNRVKEDIPAAELEQVRQLAHATTGIPVQNITVTKFKLAPPIEVKEEIADKVKSLFDDYGMFALILLLAVGLMIAAMPKKKREEEPVVEMAQAAAAGPRFIVPEMSDEPLPEIDLEERSEVKKQIEKFVKQKPEAVAQLLRNWLSDEWDM